MEILHTINGLEGNAAIFGGFEYNFRNIKKLKLKAEYDPYDYIDFSAQNNRRDASLMLRRKIVILTLA